MNKCDGIKILELDPKRILEGNEYMVIAEKDQNFKAPINQIVDLVVSDDRLKNYIIVYFNDEYTRQKEYDTPEQEII